VLCVLNVYRLLFLLSFLNANYVPVCSSYFVCFVFLDLNFMLLSYFKPLICVLSTVFLVFINYFYSTVKLLKCCIYVCYVPIKVSYLLT